MKIGSSIGAFARRDTRKGGRGKKKSQRRGEFVRVVKVIKVMEVVKVMEEMKVIGVVKVVERGRTRKKRRRGSGSS